jgi:predicted unusual protein kinase regulating ubiquinone biosynthesis (AarF/ABC1/UbiB family)
VKVQRPGIDEIVAVGLVALRRNGGWLSHVSLMNNRADATAVPLLNVIATWRRR